MKSLIVLLLLPLTIFCYSQDTHIPFHQYNSRPDRQDIILEDSIKGVKMKLYYDTGTVGNMLSDKRAEEIGLSLSNDYRSFPTLGGDIIPKRYIADFYYDPVWGLIPSAVPSHFLENYFKESVDGWVGFTPLQEKKCLEIDFQEKHLSFLDTLPSFYINNPDVQVATFTRADSGFETDFSKCFSPIPCISGTITIADSIKISTNFILDTGSPQFLSMSIMDSTLFDEIVKYKADLSAKYGDDYPSVHLEIPELSIDSLMANVRARPILEEEHLYKAPFGTNLIGGYLGMIFFLQYTKILFDYPNRLIYFYKKESE